MMQTHVEGFDSEICKSQNLAKNSNFWAKSFEKLSQNLADLIMRQ